MRAFITGSYAYGNPRPDSDIDLVVLVSPEEKLKLFQMGGGVKDTVRFGTLNLIIFTEQVDYDCWRKATDELKKKKEKTPRWKAIELIQKYLKQANRPLIEHSGNSDEEVDFD